MLLLAVKTFLTPLLLVACTVASQRWGDVVGGWLLGLPLASGPISLFLAIQHGSGFAAAAARSSLLGFVAVGVFCLSYLALARTRRWPLSLAGATAACLGTVALLSLVNLPLAGTISAAAVALFGISAVLGEAKNTRSSSAPSVGGVAVRMVIAGGTAAVLSTFSGVLGGPVTGLLAPLPVLAAIMAVAAHRREGSDAVQGLLRGIVVGTWGGVAFFSVVGALVSWAPESATYAVAVMAAALVGWAATRAAALQSRLKLGQRLHHVGRLRQLSQRRNSVPQRAGGSV